MKENLVSSIQDSASTILNPPSSIIAPGATLLNDLWCLINRFVVLPDMAAETLALWIVHTYAFTLRQISTYIGVVSPEKRCGKTTLLELLGFLASRSLTAANISPSALFRVIQETQPTLLIDEADTFLQGRDELAGILNAGYRKGNSYVLRVAEGKSRRRDGGTSIGGTSYTSPEFAQWSPDPADSLNPSANSEPRTLTPEPSVATNFAQYSCWCPKVMAAIGRLPDTLADRCIIITMQRKMPGEKCERLRHLDATEYRKRCAEFVREHSEPIAKAQPEIPSALNDRAADIWEPLLAIADLAGGEWPQLARQAALKLSAYDDELTLIGYFLKDIRTLMLNGNVDRILSRDIIRVLNPRHDRPWEDLRRGREINEWWLGHKISELGIRSRAIRSGETVAKGYMFADIDAAFRRYVPNPEMHSMQAPAAQAGP
jgi:putative DNA primase/helicase